MSRSRKNKAVALKYNVSEDAAPIVIASGYGELAQRIIDVAEKQGIPVFRDDSAVSLMCMLEVGSSIPPELYQVVAAIYCQLLQTSKEIKDGPGSAGRLAALQKEFQSSQKSADAQRKVSSDGQQT